MTDRERIRSLVETMRREGHGDVEISSELVRCWPGVDSGELLQIMSEVPEPDRPGMTIPAGRPAQDDLLDEIRARVRRRQKDPRIIADLLKEKNFSHMTPAQLAELIADVRDEVQQAQQEPEQDTGTDVYADASLPNAQVIRAASRVFCESFSPVLVNGALRLTAGGLSDPATTAKSGVFQGAYQQINFYRRTDKGKKFFVHGAISAGVFETVKRAAPEVRIGKAAFIGGQFVDAPGLHAAHRYYCTETTPALDYQGPGKHAVVELFDSLFRLFPFTDPDHLVRLFAAILTPFLMMQIAGPIPAFLISAHNPGNGKTLLAKCVSLLADGGVKALVVPWGAGSKFYEDLLGSLDSDARVVVIDNVQGELGGPTIEALITSRKIRGNLKYESSRDFNTDKVFFFTGNNVILSSDMTRRLVQIQVDRGGAPAPDDLPDLEQVIPADRGRLLGMVKTILTGWDGALLPVKGHRSFEQWAGTIGGVLASCGAPVENFRLIDPEALAQDHDADVIKWGDILQSWFSRLGESAWSANEIIAGVGTAAIKKAVSGYPGDTARALGTALCAMNGRVLCGFLITREQQKVYTAAGETYRNAYRLSKISEGGIVCTLRVPSSPNNTREGVSCGDDVSPCIVGLDTTRENQTTEEVQP